jgi:two-component system nitrogen regulation sensor histidine kinase GlnL
LLNTDGVIIGAVLLIRDQSRLQVLEEEAKRSETLASFATLAAGVAHEIKNPLLGIRGTAQLLQEELSSPELKEYTSVIIKEANRLDTLVETLLDLTRPQPLKREPRNIHQILERVLLLQKAVAQEKGIAFHCEYDLSLPEIWLDEERMIQVLVNLLQNSLEAMETGGTITITTKVAEEYQLLPGVKQGIHFALVEIHDQGVGIPEEVQDNLFTPFFTTKRRGSGLGLVISHRIVSDHGGRLLLKSQTGKGTVASVYLPLEIYLKQ